MTGRGERVGNTVRRPMNYWSPSVHDLLRYLESIDFPAPRLLRAEGGAETLTWIDGEAGPDGWAKVVPESGLRRWARFLRFYHDAVAGYRPPADSVWSSGTGTCAVGEIICHGDYGPWNGIWRGNHITGLISWDHALSSRTRPPRLSLPVRGPVVVQGMIRLPAKCAPSPRAGQPRFKLRARDDLIRNSSQRPWVTK